MKEMDDSKVVESVPVSVCDDRGEFLPQQCDPATSKCWCVDGLGNQLKGSQRTVTSSADDLGCCKYF
jgi:hypothetical protein